MLHISTFIDGQEFKRLVFGRGTATAAVEDSTADYDLEIRFDNIFKLIYGRAITIFYSFIAKVYRNLT